MIKEIKIISDEETECISLKKEFTSSEGTKIIHSLRKLSKKFLKEITKYNYINKISYAIIKVNLKKFKKDFLEKNKNLYFYFRSEEIEEIPFTNIRDNLVNEIIQNILLGQNHPYSIISLLVYIHELIEELLVKLIKSEKERNDNFTNFNEIIEKYTNFFEKIDLELKIKFNL